MRCLASSTRGVFMCGPGGAHGGGTSLLEEAVEAKQREEWSGSAGSRGWPHVQGDVKRYDRCKMFEGVGPLQWPGTQKESPHYIILLSDLMSARSGWRTTTQMRVSMPHGQWPSSEIRCVEMRDGIKGFVGPGRMAMLG